MCSQPLHFGGEINLSVAKSALVTTVHNVNYILACFINYFPLHTLIISTVIIMTISAFTSLPAYVVLTIPRAFIKYIVHTRVRCRCCNTNRRDGSIHSCIHPLNGIHSCTHPTPWHSLMCL